MLTAEQLQALEAARTAAARIAAGVSSRTALALTYDIERAMRVLKGIHVQSQAGAALELKRIPRSEPPAAANEREEP